MLNKKGFGAEQAVKLLLVALGLFLLLLIVGPLTNFYTSAGTKEACKNWVNLQSTTGLKEAYDFKSPCVTTEETIKNVKYEQEIYEKIAKNMYDCWDMYGQGEADFYSDFDWGLADNYCRICSEIKTDLDLDVNKRIVDMDQLEIYLSSNNPPGHTETYADFFTKTKNAKIDFGSGTLTLDPDKEIYTSFVVYKSSVANDFAEWGFAGGGCVAGGLIVGGVAGLFTWGAGALPGFAAGCKFGFIGGAVTGLVGYKYHLNPSITIFESTGDQIRNSCDYVYYKPI